jgi:molecular chaperone GrpE (heat shock protein)
MRESTAPKPAKLPFFIADLALLGAAYFVYSQSNQPLGVPALGMVIACVALAAYFGILPFLMEFRALMRWSESESLQSAVNQIQNLEAVASQISAATAQWQSLQEAASGTAKTARSIADSMAEEVKGFAQFMEKAQSSEKATLQLEVQKLRRAEGEWLQVLIHFLDHTYALHQAASRSTQKGVADQISAFQTACREIGRRVGLAPFVPAPSEPFNRERHQILDDKGQVPEGAVVADTLATGFTYQGRIVRPALVQLQQTTVASNPVEASAQAPQSDPGQVELSLDREPGNAA